MREDNLSFSGESIFDDLLNHFNLQCQHFKIQLEECNDLVRKAVLKTSYERCKGIISDINDLQATIFHKNVANCQRQAYKESQQPTFLKKKLMIEVDYKEKIKIGLSPRQISKEFYKQEQRSCLSKKLLLCKKNHCS
jgi:hypothetical protein